MDNLIYFVGFLALASMAILFLPVFIFFACIAGIVMIASLLF